MKVMLIDDEPLALSLLQTHLERLPGIEVLGAYTNPLIGMKEAIERPVDILFLDIDMPEINGIELAGQLLEKKPNLYVVFVTAYDEYAVQAFELNAMDYLVKPLRAERLKEAVYRVEKRMKMITSQSNPKNDHVYIRTAKSLSIQVNDEAPHVIQWRTSKTKELFLYLLQHQNEKFTKGMIQELLWPEGDPQKTSTQLYTTVYLIRVTLRKYGTAFELQSIDGGYLLATNNVTVDVKRWEETNAQLGHVTLENYLETMTHLEQFLHPYLEEADYDWIESERYRLELLWQEKAIRLADFLFDHQLYRESEIWYRHILQRFPIHEDTQFSLMKLMREIGNETEVGRLYDALAADLLKEYQQPIDPAITQWFLEYTYT